MRTLKALAMLAVLGAVAVPVAARAETAVHANIPFAFVAGNAILPPGNYHFAADTYGRIVAIQSLDQNTHALVLTNRTYRHQRTFEPARLVFNKYGDRYFLSAVWGADHTGRHVPKTRQEREASLKAPAQSIIVATR